MSQARTPTKPPKRGATAPTSQTPTGSRGAKAGRNAEDGDADKDDDVRRDMTDELDRERKTSDADSSSGAVPESEAEREIPDPVPPRSPSPAAAPRARPSVFRAAGRVGKFDSNSIRIAHVQLTTRGEPNANPSPALYMSGYGLAGLFESFASTAKNDAVEKRNSLRTIWNGAFRTNRLLSKLTNCAASGTFQYCCHPDDADKHTMRDKIFPLWSWVGFRGARRKTDANRQQDMITDTANEVKRIVAWFENSNKNANALTCEFGTLSAEQESWNVFVREKNALRGRRDPKKATALESMACFDLD